MTKKKKNIFDDLILPTDEEIKKETHSKNLSRSLKGRTRTADEIEKWRETYNGCGDNNGMYGKKHSQDSLKIMSENRKGKVGRVGPQTEETIQRMKKPRSEKGKQNMRVPKQKKICPHCKFEGGGGIMLRWHFDNCKHKQ